MPAMSSAYSTADAPRSRSFRGVAVIGTSWWHEAPVSRVRGKPGAS